MDNSDVREMFPERHLDLKLNKLASCDESDSKWIWLFIGAPMFLVGGVIIGLYSL